MELLSINVEPTTIIPAALQSFIPAFGPQPPGCYLPRNAWGQLNRLRTGVGRFGANMKLMGLCGSDLCECGKLQTEHHILHDCTKFKPPCHIIWWTTLLFWNALPNQSSDQLVLLFMYRKEEPPTKTWLNIFAILSFRPKRIVLPPVSSVYTTDEEWDPNVLEDWKPLG